EQIGIGVYVLAGGGFVVQSYNYHGSGADYGTATFCASVTDSNCIGHAVSAENSLTGSIPNSMVSSFGIAPLPNGDYLVKSPSWRKDVDTRTGSLTYCTVSGATSSCTGQTVTQAHSLIGDRDQDSVGSGGIPL